MIINIHRNPEPTGWNPGEAAYTLGTTFKSTIAGKVLGVQFYLHVSQSPNQGRMAYLWQTDGTLLASAAFSNEIPGWNSAYFSSPVDIAANTPYVIGYTNDDTHFYNEFNGYASAGRSFGCITFPQNGTTPEINSRYDLAVDTFPNASLGMNYWVDIIFDDLDIGETVSIYDSGDAAGGAESTDTAGYTLGQTFSSAIAGEIRGIKFYKAPGCTGTHIGSLWSSGGTKLAEATFTGETASGWQTVLFPTAVQITAGTKYVAAYTTTVGKYWAQLNHFLSRKFGNPPLNTGKGDDPGGCGRYTDIGSGVTSSNPLFLAPSNTSYFVDVLFGSDSRVIVPALNEAIAVTDARTVTVTTALTENIACSATSTPNSWTLTAGATKQAAVATSDDATSYISSTGTINTQQQFVLADTATIKSQDNIVSVHAFVRARRGAGSNSDFNVTLILGGNTTVSATLTSLTAWNDHRTEYLARPGGGTWTDADLDALEIRLTNTQSRAVDVSTLYLKVSYVPITAYYIGLVEDITVSDPPRIAPTPLRIQAFETQTVSEGIIGVTVGNATGFWAPFPPPGLVTNILPAATLGTVFKTNAPGKVLGVRFYKGSATDNPATRTGSLWTLAGTKLATAEFTTNDMGWNTAVFSSPVTLTVGAYYIASFTNLTNPVISAPYHAGYTHINYPLEVPSNDLVNTTLNPPIVGQGCWDTTAPTPPDHHPTAAAFAIATFADVLFEATVDLSVNQFETVTVTDPQTVVIPVAAVLTVNRSEDVTVTENVKVALDRVVQLQELASVSESFKIGLDLAQQRIEGPVVTEFVKVALDLALQKTETGSVTEYVLVACDIAVRSTEVVAVTEFAKPVLDLAINYFEFTGAVENFKVVVDPLVARQVENNTITDPCTIYESPWVVRSVEIPGVTESAQVQVLDLAARNTYQVENIAVTESFRVVLDILVIRQVEDIAVLELVKPALDGALSRIETSVVTEYVLVALDLALAVYETTGPVTEYSRVVLDSLVIRVGEDITVTENLIIQAGAASYPLQQTETIGVTEHFRLALDVAIQSLDLISCSESLQITLVSNVLAVQVQDPIFVSDPFQIQFTGNQYYATAADTVSVSEAYAVYVGIAIRLDETSTVDDQVNLAFTPAQYFFNIAEPVTVSDPCTVGLLNTRYYVSKTEQITVTDEVSPRLVGEIAGEVFQEETTTTSDSLVLVSVMPFSAQVQTMITVVRNTATEATAPYGSLITERNQPARSSIFGESRPPHDLKG